MRFFSPVNGFAAEPQIFVKTAARQAPPRHAICSACREKADKNGRTRIFIRALRKKDADRSIRPIRQNRVVG